MNDACVDRRDTALIARFWSKVDKDGPVPDYAPELGSCWLWTGLLQKGYGRFSVDQRYQFAHRFSLSLVGRVVPSGYHTDHLCRIRACVNPTHLDIVTPQMNLLRGDTIPARNAAKTHCKHGHEFTPENTYRRTDNAGRQCRVCIRASRARFKERHGY